MKMYSMLALACAFLIGCAAPRGVVDPSWKEKPASVKVVFTEPFVANPEDLQDDLPDYVDHFQDWYLDQLLTNLAKFAKGVKFSGEMISRDKVKYESGAMEGGNVKVPKYDSMQGDADIYLVMDDLWIGRTEVQSTCSTGMGAAGGAGMSASCMTPALANKGSFAYYDAKTGKRLAYGDFQENMGFTFGVSANDWKNVLYMTSQTLLKKTPLQ